ncbi:hypothetical protein C7I84_03935 [Mesorhizobium ephedrae]|uniref:Lytic murein transglycosylase n=1 Tax=Kumtagia ephedrae TaxID=2116701 RepID=A0A2P7SQN5_9HYPH|nr:hypothetical protein C7I84_03935 [Mesorhizobium ephedrae]
MPLRTPLCPKLVEWAGHLPRKMGDQQLRSQHISSSAGDLRTQTGQLISPLAGEMSGRTEGGAKGRGLPSGGMQ